MSMTFEKLLEFEFGVMSLKKFYNLQARPMRIWVRIDSPHFLVCCKRRLNGAVLRMRPEKLSPVTAGVAQ
jgi:hypothetical protein